MLKKLLLSVGLLAIIFSVPFSAHAHNIKVFASASQDTASEGKFKFHIEGQYFDGKPCIACQLNISSTSPDILLLTTKTSSDGTFTASFPTPLNAITIELLDGLGHRAVYEISSDTFAVVKPKVQSSTPTISKIFTGIATIIAIFFFISLFRNFRAGRK